MTADRPQGLPIEKLLQGVREAFIARADAVFDFDSGLKDVYARARLVNSRHSADPPAADWRTATADAVQRQIDRLASMLRLIDRGYSQTAFDHLQRAMELLFEIRAGWPDNRLSRSHLMSLMAMAADHVKVADAALRSHSKLSLAEAVQTKLNDLGPISVDPIDELETLRCLTQEALNADPPAARPRLNANRIWDRGQGNR
jgi:hypothetical protein